MNSIFKRLLSKKGVSLVELIVAMAITSVILLIATSMLAPANNLMNSIKGNAHLDTLCDTANEYIRGALQTAVSISVYKYDSSTLNDIEIQADNYIKSGLKTKALAVIEIPVETDASGNQIKAFRLFDFTTIIDKTTLMNDLSIADIYKNGAFLEPFYEKTSFSVKISTPTNDTGASSWIKLKSRCYNIYSGDQNNQEKTMTFKCLNGNTGIDTGSTVQGDGTDEPYEGSFVILYTVKDFSSIKT